MKSSFVVIAALLGFAVLLGVSQASAGNGELSAAPATRASAVSGPIINVTPASHDFGRVNVGSSSGSFTFTVSNTGAPR